MPRTVKDASKELIGSAEETRPAQVSEADIYNNNPDFDLTTLKNDKVEYFWASTNQRHPQYFERMRRRGWELVEHDPDRPIAPNASVVDGRYFVDDVVLMQKDAEEYQKQMKQHERDYLRHLKDNEEEFTEAMMRNANEDVDIRVVESGKEVATSPSRSSFYIKNNPLAKET